MDFSFRVVSIQLRIQNEIYPFFVGKLVNMPRPYMYCGETSVKLATQSLKECYVHFDTFVQI